MMCRAAMVRMLGRRVVMGTGSAVMAAGSSMGMSSATRVSSSGMSSATATVSTAAMSERLTGRTR